MHADQTPLTAEEIAAMRSLATGCAMCGKAMPPVRPEIILRLCDAAEYAAAKDADNSQLRKEISYLRMGIKRRDQGLAAKDAEIAQMIEQHDAASAEFHALRQRAEKAEADARRVDWIADNWFWREKYSGVIHFCFNEMWTGGEHLTLRDAIDAAIAASQPAAEGAP